MFAQESELRKVENFTGIKAYSVVKVVIRTSDTNYVKVESQSKSDLEKIKTKVKGSVLEIYAEGNLETETKVYVGIKDLQHIEATGAADIRTSGNMSVNNLKIESSGAGNVKLDLSANDIELYATGAGNVILSGSANSIKITASGASTVKAFKLAVNNANVEASGAANVKVNAVKSIKASASGAGNIEYKGNPTDKQVEVSGAGSVKNEDGDGEKVFKSDTTNILFGDKKIIIFDEENEKSKKSNKTKNNNKEIHSWAGIGLGVNGFLNASNSLELPASYDYLKLNYSKSLTFNLNLFEKDFHIYKNYVNLVTGFGFEFNHFAFDKAVTLNPDVDYVAGTIDSNVEYKKNKLNASYVTMPLMFAFNSNIANPSKSFHFAAGVVGAYKIGSKTKQEFEINGTEYFVKRKDSYNLNPFRLSATVRAGYGDVYLFATYALTELFDAKGGPRLYPFTAGICLSFD